MGEKSEGIEKYKLGLTGSHGYVNYSLGNIVNNIVIISYGSGEYWKYWGEHFMKYITV